MKRIIGILFLLLLIGNSAFSLNPSRKYEIKPEDYGMAYEKLTIPTEDELVNLHAWYFTPSEATKRIVIISDDGVGNMADNIELVSQWLSLGYHVICYDYRGFGESSDFNINPKFYIYSEFMKDLTHVINYVKKYHAKLTVVDLYGIGIGAGLSMAVGCNNINIKRVLADAPYYSLEHMKNRIKDIQGETVIMPLGYNKYFMEPKYALTEHGKHLYGILIIVGETDPVIGPVEYKMFAKGSIPKVSVYIAEGVVNDQNFSSNKDEYFNQIKKFLKL